MTRLRAHRDRLRVRRLEQQARRLLRRRPELVAGISPQALALYEQFRGLSTNRMNRLRLQHDRVMRPEELQELLLAWLVSGESGEALAAWLCETCLDAPTLLSSPAAYDARVERLELADAELRWYRRLPRDGEPVRRLVLAFASNANAVAMIAPCFLHVLGPFQTDVVLVLRRRPQQQSFFGPVGRSSLLAQLLSALPDLVPLDSYAELLSLGYSGGGIAAAVAAVALGADRGVSFGGWPPQGSTILDRAWIASLLSGLPPPRPVHRQLRLCCAAGCASDVQGTSLARDQVAAWQLPRVSLETRAYLGCRDHNLLVELQRRGHALAPLLAELLFPDDGDRHRRPRWSRRPHWRPLPETTAP